MQQMQDRETPDGNPKFHEVQCNACKTPPDPGGIAEISRWREPPEPVQYHVSAPQGMRVKLSE